MASSRHNAFSNKKPPRYPHPHPKKIATTVSKQGFFNLSPKTAYDVVNYDENASVSALSVITMKAFNKQIEKNKNHKGDRWKLDQEEKGGIYQLRNECDPTKIIPVKDSIPFVIIFNPKERKPELWLGRTSHLFLVKNETPVGLDKASGKLVFLDSNQSKEFKEENKPVEASAIMAGEIKFKDGDILEVTDQSGGFHRMLEYNKKFNGPLFSTDVEIDQFRSLLIIMREVGLPLEKIHFYNGSDPIIRFKISELIQEVNKFYNKKNFIFQFTERDILMEPKKDNLMLMPKSVSLPALISLVPKEIYKEISMPELPESAKSAFMRPRSMSF